MKRLLLVGALSLVAGGLGSGQASAGLFHWCGCQCECNGYRPYNAFDPGCYGCQEHHHCGLLGCCCHGHGHAQPPSFVPPPCFMPPPCMPSCYNGMSGNSCMNSGCCDAGCLPAPDATSTGPTAPAAPAPAGQNATAPAPSPLPDTSQMYNYPMPYGQNMFNAPGSYPGYYTGYYPGNPMGNYAPMQAYPMRTYAPMQGNPMGNYAPMQAYPMGNYAPMQAYPMQYGAYGMPGYGYNFGR